MLTSYNYEKGIAINETIKYNIAYDRNKLFNTVLSSLADKLLNNEFSSDLTVEQKEILEKLITQ
jgi:hypothetical protein